MAKKKVDTPAEEAIYPQHKGRKADYMVSVSRSGKLLATFSLSACCVADALKDAYTENCRREMIPADDLENVQL